jgi:hypothetical protein
MRGSNTLVRDLSTLESGLPDLAIRRTRAGFECMIHGDNQV